MSFSDFLGSSKSDIAPQLVAEIDSEARWMYEWHLGAGIVTPVLGDELTSVHETRREMIEGPIREHLMAQETSARALDLACNEGYFSHRLLEWGAREIIGIDIRDTNIRRANLLREHFQIGSAHMRFMLDDIFAIGDEQLGVFDVVLNLGLIYHVEDPIGAMRIARKHTAPGGLCVVETQLTRQTGPITVGTGRTGIYDNVEAGFAALYEHDQDDNLLSSAGGVVSLVPNRAALMLSMRAVGFERVRFLEPAGNDLNPQYVRGDRAIIIGFAPN